MFHLKLDKSIKNFYITFNAYLILLCPQLFASGSTARIRPHMTTCLDLM